MFMMIELRDESLTISFPELFSTGSFFILSFPRPRTVREAYGTGYALLVSSFFKRTGRKAERIIFYITFWMKPELLSG